MNGIDILQKIVTENGSCDWADDEGNGALICARCPIGNLKLKPDGKSFYSCLEVVTTRDDVGYKKLAEQLLVDAVFEQEMLKD